MTSFFKWTFKQITETQRNHDDVRGLVAAQPGSSYFRFDVPHNPRGLPFKGLADIGLAECEKMSIKPAVPTQAGATALTPHLQRVEQRDSPLRLQATETRKGGYKPQKYRYATFDKLRDRTTLYCNVGVKPNSRTLVLTDIQRCAELLRAQSLARKANDLQRWNNFRTHPDPHHN